MIKRGWRKLTPVRIVLLVAILTVATIALFWFLLDGKNIAVLNPQGTIAAQQKNLILFTLMLSLIVVVPVFAMLGIFAWKYREGNKTAKYTPEVEGNRWLELLWWGIPIVIIAILGYVTVKSTHELDPYKPFASNVKPIKIQVVALQWKWLFLYPEQHIASVNVLRIPVGTPVNFELTADGPMSGFWVPNLGSQTYAMSGMSAKLTLQADKAGTYRGANSNINGEGYSDMHFNVIAMSSRAEFDTWANAIGSESDHKHLDWLSYESMVKPAVVKTPAYYHLHNKELYDKVVNKYMASHSSSETMQSHKQGEGESH